MVINRKHVPPELKNIAYNAYWLDKNNADLIDVIVAVINAWPGVEYTDKLEVRDNAEGYDLVKTGIRLPIKLNKE